MEYPQANSIPAHGLVHSISPTSPPATELIHSTCAFAPHVPLRQTQSSFSIPPSAWPLIRTLLSSHILPPPPSSNPQLSTSSEPQTSPDNPSPPPVTQAALVTHNSVQTLNLKDPSDDASLEGVVLGLVFSTGAREAAEKELRSIAARDMEGGEAERRTCVEEAVRKVEQGRTMEGVLELDGRGGTVGFLVYRVD